MNNRTAPHLTERLAMTAGMVRRGKPLADIGTDHAYLPVWLVLQGIIPSAYASDLREGPLQHAENTVKQYGVSDRVTLLLSDGLRSIPTDFCRDFVLAGMGGNLISDILDGAGDRLKQPDTHLVLQPMSHAEDLRRFLFDSGFRILRERVAEEPGHLYLAMEADFTGEIHPYTISDCYLGELVHSDSPQKDAFLQQVLRRLTTRFDALLGKPDFAEECAALSGVIRTVKESMS